MLKHGVKDIREFYKSNLDFLSQFKWKLLIVTWLGISKKIQA
jgi:hypothetical protein